MNLPSQGPARLVRYPLYAISDLSTGIYAVTPSILLMFYMTNILGISVGWATAASFLPKVVDVIVGPWIGALSDRSTARLGRRRVFILFGGLTILPTFLLIWTAPFASPVLSACFIIAAFSVCAVCFSAYVVPYSALNTEVAPRYHDSTSLNSFRATYSMIGALLAGAGSPLIVQALGGGKAGYAAMAGVMGGVMMLSILVTYFFSREPQRHVQPPRMRLADMRRCVSDNRPFRVLLLAYFVHIVGSGTVGAGLAYFVTYQLRRDTDFLSLMFFVSFAASILAIPLFAALGKRRGKFFAYGFALCTSALFGTGYFIVGEHTPTSLLILAAALAGISEGGIQVFAFSMLIDSIRHGNASPEAPAAEALMSGLFMAGEKVGFATGVAVAGGIFYLTGLVETTEGFVPQPASAVFGIRLATSLVPVAFHLLSLAIFFAYRSFDRDTSGRRHEDGEPAVHPVM
jgi:Na+/melibiose symporter-like transporter